MSWLGKLHRAKAKLAESAADPLRGEVDAAVRGKAEISTHALLALLGLPATTGSARRISGTMRSLGFIAIKSRRLMPGGYRDTVTRGWARPVRELNHKTFRQGDKVGSRHLDTHLGADQQKDARHV